MGLSTHINSLEETWYTFHVRAQTRQLEYNAKTRAHSNLYSYASPYIVHSSFVYSLYMPCWVSARRCPYPAHSRTKKVIFFLCVCRHRWFATRLLYLAFVCRCRLHARAQGMCLVYAKHTHTDTNKKQQTNVGQINEINSDCLQIDVARKLRLTMSTLRGTQFHSIKDGR